MSWKDYYRRNEIIDGVLTDVDRTGRADIPTRWRRPIADTFGGQEAFLAAVHYRWLNTLTARLDPVLESVSGELGTAARMVRQELAVELPALWALLCAYTCQPSLIAAREVEQQRCGWAGTEPAWWAGTTPAAVATSAKTVTG